MLRWISGNKQNELEHNRTDGNTIDFTINKLLFSDAEKPFVCQVQIKESSEKINSSASIRGWRYYSYSYIIQNNNACMRVYCYIFSTVLNPNLYFEGISVFSGEKTRMLKCVFMATPRPEATIENAKGLMLPSKIHKKARKYRYTAYLSKESIWKLENAGKVSCRVYYKNSNVEAIAQAAVNSKNIYNKILIYKIS